MKRFRLSPALPFPSARRERAESRVLIDRLQIKSRLERGFDAQWRERVADSWRQVHEKHQRLIGRAAQSQLQTGTGAQPASGAVQLQDH